MATVATTLLVASAAGAHVEQLLPISATSHATRHLLPSFSHSGAMRLASVRGYQCTRAWSVNWRQAPSRASYATKAAAGNAPNNTKRVVFLGTPEVAAIALKELLDASKHHSASFELAAVVSQPGKPKGRGNRGVPTPSPVEQLARGSGILDNLILCPKSAKDPAFLEAFAALQPDLAVTAAYGNMLPTAFLNIPKHGTLNIHPSLLPKYRGAAPVQRAVQDGVSTTGVSVAFTVLKCDAGPVFLQETVSVSEDETAPELLERLFRQGAQMLVRNLDRVWTGEAAAAAQQQDEALATHAVKIAKEESQLDFAQSATSLHNKVRAFAGWPGTFAAFRVSSSSGSQEQQIKILQSRVSSDAADVQLVQSAESGQVVFADNGSRMLVPCGDSSVLEVLSLQPPTKKAMTPKAFYNGLTGKQLFVH